MDNDSITPIPRLHGRDNRQREALLGDICLRGEPLEQRTGRYGVCLLFMEFTSSQWFCRNPTFRNQFSARSVRFHQLLLGSRSSRSPHRVIGSKMACFVTSGMGYIYRRRTVRNRYSPLSLASRTFRTPPRWQDSVSFHWPMWYQRAIRLEPKWLHHAMDDELGCFHF